MRIALIWQIKNGKTEFCAGDNAPALFLSLSVEKSKLALFLDSWNERYWEIQKRYFAAVRYSGDAAGI